MSDGPTELIASQPATLDSIDRALDGVFRVERLDTWESDHVLLDTFDRLLRGEGWTLAHEHGRLALSDREMLTPIEAGPPSDPPTGPLFSDDLGPGALKEMVTDTIEVRALLPLGRLHIRTEAYRILDDLQKTVVRLHVLVPQLVSPRGSSTPLSTRLRVEEVRGYGDECEEVIQTLSAALGVSDPAQSLPDEAVIATGSPAEGVSTKVEVALSPDEPSGPAVAKVLRALLEVIEANLPGTLANTDSEFLHDYRVSVRRTRAVQREFKHVFDPEALAQARADFKWLQQSTGEARDLDVYVLDFEALRELLPEDSREDLEPLLVALRRRRTVAHGAIARSLRSDRARELIDNWRRLLDVLDHGPDTDRHSPSRNLGTHLAAADLRDASSSDPRNSAAIPSGPASSPPLIRRSPATDQGFEPGSYTARPIGEYASRRIRRVYRKMLAMGEAIGPDSPPDQFHELRKKGKELRYLLELFGQPLHDSSVVKPMIKTLKSLQDLLGQHQDREVQIAMLRALADDVGVLPGGSRALMAMGALSWRLEEDAAELRAEFAGVFKAFAAKDQRKLVKDTFA